MQKNCSYKSQIVENGSLNLILNTTLSTVSDAQLPKYLQLIESNFFELIISGLRSFRKHLSSKKYNNIDLRYYDQNVIDKVFLLFLEHDDEQVCAESLKLLKNYPFQKELTLEQDFIDSLIDRCNQFLYMRNFTFKILDFLILFSRCNSMFLEKAAKNFFHPLLLNTQIATYGNTIKYTKKIFDLFSLFLGDKQMIIGEEDLNLILIEIFAYFDFHDVEITEILLEFLHEFRIVFNSDIFSHLKILIPRLIDNQYNEDIQCIFKFLFDHDDFRLSIFENEIECFDLFQKSISFPDIDESLQYKFLVHLNKIFVSIFQFPFNSGIDDMLSVLRAHFLLEGTFKIKNEILKLFSKIICNTETAGKWVDLDFLNALNDILQENNASFVKSILNYCPENQKNELYEELLDVVADIETDHDFNSKNSFADSGIETQNNISSQHFSDSQTFGEISTSINDSPETENPPFNQELFFLEECTISEGLFFLEEPHYVNLRTFVNISDVLHSPQDEVELNLAEGSLFIEQLLDKYEVPTIKVYSFPDDFSHDLDCIKVPCYFRTQQDEKEIGQDDDELPLITVSPFFNSSPNENETEENDNELPFNQESSFSDSSQDENEMEQDGNELPFIKVHTFSQILQETTQLPFINDPNFQEGINADICPFIKVHGFPEQPPEKNAPDTIKIHAIPENIQDINSFPFIQVPISPGESHKSNGKPLIKMAEENSTKLHFIKVFDFPKVSQDSDEIPFIEGLIFIEIDPDMSEFP